MLAGDRAHDTAESQVRAFSCEGFLFIQPMATEVVRPAECKRQRVPSSLFCHPGQRLGMTSQEALGWDKTHGRGVERRKRKAGTLSALRL